MLRAPLPRIRHRLRSPSDPLPDLQTKMGDWLCIGAELAWLLDSERKTVGICRPGLAAPEVLAQPVRVEGEGPVAGFVLETERIRQGP